MVCRCVVGGDGVNVNVVMIVLYHRLMQKNQQYCCKSPFQQHLNLWEIK